GICHDEKIKMLCSILGGKNCAELQVGPCRAAFQRWYFNSLTGRCQRFIYGGCKGNKNNYENEEKILKENKNCMVTSDPGPCRAAFPAFYYDHKTSTCRSFTYGGCRGNKNRYNTMEECTNRCRLPLNDKTELTEKLQPVDEECFSPYQLFSSFYISPWCFLVRSHDPPLSSSLPVLCRLPMKVGSCRAAFPRFFYNVTDQTCRRFTYGGCDANSNNFETKEVRVHLQRAIKSNLHYEQVYIYKLSF
uniref:BPTI/Kunitz inhibitor domain-containing protein n=1 Tax=Sphaeramia orbicularis TaxID=375764 RepID=A0A673C5K2_9TELE